MWRLVWALFLPGALGRCQRPVEMPETLLAWPGTCLQIPCRYQACFTPFTNANPGLVHTLVWYHNPLWNRQTNGYDGMELARIEAALPPVLASRVSFLGDLKSNCSLLIQNVEVRDNGTYGVWVNASYPPGKMNTKGERYQRWMEKIEVKVAAVSPTPHLEGSEQLREGARAQLRCSLLHHCPLQPLSLAWRGLEGLRGTQSRSWARLDTGGAETVAQLDLTPQRGDHRRVLTCALDTPSAPVASLMLQVLYPPRNVTLTVMPGPVVTEGQSVQLRCDVLGGANPPIYQYHWSQNWNTLEEQSPELKFTAQVPRSTGTYHCTAQNSEGMDTSPDLSLQVQYAPRAMVLRLESVPARAGAPAVLLCSCQAEPPATSFRWFWDRRELPGQDRAQLKLSSAQPKDAGAYVCEARNSIGSARSAPWDLVVLYPPEAVRLVLEPKGQVLEGTVVRLSCAGGDACPAPTWAWYHDGQPLALHLSGPMLELSVGPQHRGAYACEAQNELGTNRSLPATLDVLFRPREVQVQVEPQAGRKVLAGTPVEMRCAVGSAQPPPTTFTWFLDNATLAPPGPDSALHLPHAHPHHAGQYHCRAENIAGAADSPSHILEVWYPPQAVRLLVEPGGRLVEGGTAMLRCETKAWPHPHRYDWYHNGVWLGWGVGPAWPLPRLQLQATGTYYCRATNHAGVTDGALLVLTVHYSAATVRRITAVASGGSLALLILLGALVLGLWRWRKRQQVPNDIVPVVGGQRSFWVKHKKVRHQEGGARLGFRPPGPPGTPDDALNYSEIWFPPGSHDGLAASPRMPQGDTVVYSVLKKPDGPQKAEARGDYENVGSAEEPELHYCSLVLPTRPARRPDPVSDSDSDSDGSVQYAALRH